MPSQVLEDTRACPYLVTLHYAFQTASKLYLVLEYAVGGDLFTHVSRRDSFHIDHMRIYIAEVVLAIEQLHLRNVIYRDLKAENILLDADGHIVVADLGLCKRLNGRRERTYTYCGTLECMAPEVVQWRRGHDLAADWWSLGVLMYEMAIGESPFIRDAGRNRLKDIKRRIVRAQPSIPGDLDADCADLMAKLLVKDPGLRLNGRRRNAAGIKAHPFFARIDWTELAAKRVPAPFRPTIRDAWGTGNFDEDYTRMTPTDTPSLDANHQRLFRGWSFVAAELREPRRPESPRSALLAMLDGDWPMEPMEDDEQLPTAVQAVPAEAAQPMATTSTTAAVQATTATQREATTAAAATAAKVQAEAAQLKATEMPTTSTTAAKVQAKAAQPNAKELPTMATTTVPIADDDIIVISDDDDDDGVRTVPKPPTVAQFMQRIHILQVMLKHFIILKGQRFVVKIAV